MNNDDDMLITMDGLSMDDIGSQHYQWSADIDLYDDLAHYFILAYEQHCQTIEDNSSTTNDDDDDDDDTFFLNNWERQDIEQRVNLEGIINKNPMGLVAIDANQPSLLPSQLISINQQQQPIPAKPKKLKRAPSLSASRPSRSSSKPQGAKDTNKKSKPIRQLRSKNPNL